MVWDITYLEAPAGIAARYDIIDMGIRILDKVLGGETFRAGVSGWLIGVGFPLLDEWMDEWGKMGWT